MWVEEISPERLPEFFRHYRQALEALRKGNESRSWEEVAKPDKDRIVAVAYLTLLGPDPAKDDPTGSKRYFAEPGEAEWGC